MSADLLRRAATKLRERAERPAGWMRQIWFSPLARSDSTAVADPLDMHGPVALALAEMLDHVADDVSDAGDRVEVGGLVRNEYDTIRFDWAAAVKLAREVLREPEVTP